MKLLIITQKVDRNDPVLGFFHRWIEEFAKNFEKVTVIALGVGDYDLPRIKVLSLGKERGLSRLGYLWNFYKYIWRERKNYDTVFVHMNQIYVILGSLVWVLLRKPVGLWYTHKQVSLSLRLAERMTDLIFTASEASFRLKSDKVRVMGHGIDTEFFAPDLGIARTDQWLSVGRLMPTKRHDIAIREAFEANKELCIAGSGPEQGNLEALARCLGARVRFLGPLTQEELRNQYRRVGRLIHRSETGSLDKVVLEAAASGLEVDSTDPAISKLPLSSEYVRDSHSLPVLIENIYKLLSKAQ